MMWRITKHARHLRLPCLRCLAPLVQFEAVSDEGEKRFYCRPCLQVAIPLVERRA